MLTMVKLERASCGCLVGRYLNTVTDRELACVEVPDARCRHRRNDPIESPSSAPEEIVLAPARVLTA